MVQSQPSHSGLEQPISRPGSVGTEGARLSKGPAAAATHKARLGNKSNIFGFSGGLRLVLRTQSRSGKFARRSRISVGSNPARAAP